MNPSRRRFLQSAAAAGISLMPVRLSQAAPDASRSFEAHGRQMVTPEAQLAITRGLSWLAARQHDDGSFGSGSAYRRNVAVAGLCGMAFLSAGSTPGRGRYGRLVRKIIDFLISTAQPSGYIIAPESASHGPMYGHGFATLFLADAYGMSGEERLREVLKNAVRLIVNSQNKDGGWRYEPESTDADISVTVSQIMALRAARNAGIAVPKSTVDRCIDYVRRCQNSDGGFRYQLLLRPQSIFPRSAAGVVALYSAGVYEGEEIERGLDYLMRYLPQGDLFRYESHYYYGHYYAVQAMWHAGGDYWRKWYPAIRDELLTRQLPEGSWPDALICNEYGSAMALLVLQTPNNYLPIFQR